jgi:hypothetical protein
MKRMNHGEHGEKHPAILAVPVFPVVNQGLYET